MAGSCGLADAWELPVTGRGGRGARMEDVRFERVLELRRALASGRYFVPAAALADAMLREQRAAAVRGADGPKFVMQ